MADEIINEDDCPYCAGSEEVEARIASGKTEYLPCPHPCHRLATPAPDSEKPLTGCTAQDEDAAGSEIASGSIDSEKLREAYLVWSNEHQAWWGKDHCGYTRFIDRAGRYDRAEALSIAGTRDGGWHVRKGNPDEIAIPERDAIEQYASITQSQQDAALQESAR